MIVLFALTASPANTETTGTWTVAETVRYALKEERLFQDGNAYEEVRSQFNPAAKERLYKIILNEDARQKSCAIFFFAPIGDKEDIKPLLEYLKVSKKLSRGSIARE